MRGRSGKWATLTRQTQQEVVTSSCPIEQWAYRMYSKGTLFANTFNFMTKSQQTSNFYEDAEYYIIFFPITKAKYQI